MKELSASDKRKLQTGVYIRCKQCERPQASKHDLCLDCRRRECPQCKKPASRFIGRICSACMRARGRE
jgi:hypothetical protein